MSPEDRFKVTIRMAVPISNPNFTTEPHDVFADRRLMKTSNFPRCIWLNRRIFILSTPLKSELHSWEENGVQIRHKMGGQREFDRFHIHRTRWIWETDLTETKRNTVDGLRATSVQSYRSLTPNPSAGGSYQQVEVPLRNNTHRLVTHSENTITMFFTNEWTWYLEWWPPLRPCSVRSCILRKTVEARYSLRDQTRKNAHYRLLAHNVFTWKEPAKTETQGPHRWSQNDETWRSVGRSRTVTRNTSDFASNLLT